VGLERGPLSLVSTTEELLGRENSCSGLENREYGWRDPDSQRVTEIRFVLSTESRSCLGVISVVAGWVATIDPFLHTPTRLHAVLLS
jgi:hypothetical protein